MGLTMQKNHFKEVKISEDEKTNVRRKNMYKMKALAPITYVDSVWNAMLILSCITSKTAFTESLWLCVWEAIRSRYEDCLTR